MSSEPKSPAVCWTRSLCGQANRQKSTQCICCQFSCDNSELRHGLWPDRASSGLILFRCTKDEVKVGFHR
jgi:hypothetical protein